MTLNEKCVLYEKIMRNVSEVIKRHLNEYQEFPADFMDIFRNTFEGKLITSALWTVLSGGYTNPYNMSDAKVRKMVFNAWIKELRRLCSFYKSKNKNIDADTLIAKYGLKLDRFCTAFHDHADEIQKLEIENSNKKSNVSGFTTAAEKRQRTAYKQYQQYRTEVGEGVPISEINTIQYDPKNDERLLLIRPKYEGSEPLVYVLRGKLTRNSANPYKYVYAYETSPRCNYCAARPILWDTVKDDPKRWYCTVSWENEDDVYED